MPVMGDGQGITVRKQRFGRLQRLIFRFKQVKRCDIAALFKKLLGKISPAGTEIGHPAGNPVAELGRQQLRSAIGSG